MRLISWIRHRGSEHKQYIFKEFFQPEFQKAVASTIKMLRYGRFLASLFL
jgi:hypothetical protein